MKSAQATAPPSYDDTIRNQSLSAHHRTDDERLSDFQTIVDRYESRYISTIDDIEQ
jgi:hypothetical protein